MIWIFCTYSDRGIKLLIIYMALVFGGLVWLNNAHAAFNLDVRDLSNNSAIPAFTYMVNQDNTADPFDPNPMKHPGVAPMPSYSPIVAAGRRDPDAGIDTATNITLDPGRYLISVRAPDYKLWGRHIWVSADGQVFDADGNNLGNTVRIDLRPAPLPLSKLEVLVFEDWHLPDGFPDDPFEVNLVGGSHGSVTDMANFHVVLNDGTGQVVVDWFGNPICGTGKCLTNARGQVTIPNLPHGKFEITVIPPTGSGWIQTTTYEGSKQLDAWLEEGSDGKGAPGKLVREPATQTIFVFGFVHPTKRNTLPTNGSGTITGTVKNLVVFPPGEQPTFGEPVSRPWIVVTDLSTDAQVKVVRGDTLGRFTITGVPAGRYQLMIFDENLYYIMWFYTVQVQNGQTVSPGFDPDPTNCATPNVNCRVGLFRWFGWLSGYVFLDSNGNGIRDSNETTGISNVEVHAVWRDGSVGPATVTNSSGFYELPKLLSPMGKMFNAEVGFTNFARTGHAKHRERFANYNQRDPNPLSVDTGVGGGLILSQGVLESKRSMVDWGKKPYTGTDNGGISGRVLYATTRNEYDARMAAAEDYEPGIPNVTVQLWGLGPDGQPNTPDDVLLNVVQTDAWQMPRVDNPDNPGQNDLSQPGCDVFDKDGNPIPPGQPGNPFLTDGTSTPRPMAEYCTEVPALGNETHPGAYDGGWAMESICPPPGYPCDPENEISPMPPGQYVIQVIPPPFYQVVKEEDNNTGEGNELVPQLPPPPCVGDLHTVPPLPDFPDFPYTGQQMPLCDKRLVTLQARQNAGLDIFLFTTDAPYSLNNPGSSWTSAQAVPPPGRFFGLVENNIHRNLDPQSITYGELRSVPGVPIGIYEYGEPVSPGGPRSAVGRRLRTVFADENGFYEVLLPSTATFNTPIPGGVSPAMYVMVINDPGSDPANPNPSYSKANLSDTYVFDAWPGKMTPTDTPVEPSTSEVCGAPPDAPQLFHVSAPNNAGPVVTAGQNTNITITGFRFGNTQAGPPTVTLDSNDLDTTPGVQLPLVSWTPADPAVQRFEDVVVVTVPSTFPAGPAQLLLRSGPVVDVVNGQTTGLQVSRNGMTIHVRGGNYNPTLVYVNPPASGITCDPAVPGTCVIQDAINSAAVVALTAPPPLIVVRPGTYRENVIFHKRVTLQGFGPGGEAGAGNVEVTDFPCATLPCPNFTLPTEEPFTHIPGTVIDGRFFHFVQGKRGAWQTTLTTQASPFAGPATVPAGAGITVVANTTEFGAEGGVAARLAPRIDGFGIITSRGEAGGGIYVHAFGRNLIISNNILDANTGTHGGAISLGQPLVRGGLANHQNDRIRIHHNRMLSSGGVFFAGAVGIFGGADNYRFDNNDVCGGFSAEYGGCFSHWGRSPGANIHDNRFYYCEAVDEGGGLMISGGDMTPAPLGPGSGTVTIARNLIQSNLSWDDGGGIRLLRPLGGTANRVNIINNMIVNNVATDFGGGIALDDAANVVIVNNTIASNVSTQTAEDSNLGEAHGAGIASELHSPAFLATLPAGSPRFSSPVLFNNIIFDNLAYRWGMMTPEDGSPRPGLVPTAYIDLEVVDGLSATDCLAVNYSFLSRRHLSPTGSLCPAGTGNIFADGGDPATLTLPSPDPLFIRPLTAGQVDIVVAGGRFNPNELIPFLHRTEGMLLGFTDYHLQGAPAFPANSLAINAGINALGGVSAPTNDFDGNTRPQRGTLFDMGADEVLP